MTESKISIIIPVYNVEKYLRKALDSVINQTLKDLEILCINDCSPDNSLEILKEYQNKDNRIKIINLEENHGQGYGRNLGIEKATGKYIMFLDPDDWYTPDACEIAYNKISQNNNDFVLFEYCNFFEEDNTWTVEDLYSKTFQNVNNKNNINPKELDFFFFFNAYTWNRIYKTSFIKEHNIRFSTARFGEDTRFLAMVLANATSFSFIEKPLYYYLQKSNNQMTLDYTKHWPLVIENHMNNLEYIKTFNNKNITKNYLTYSIDSILFWFKKFSYINRKIEKPYYAKMRSAFKKIKKENDFSHNYPELESRLFKIVLKHNNVISYKLVKNRKQILNSILSLRNNKGYKTFTILGIKIKLYKNKKS